MAKKIAKKKLTNRELSKTAGGGLLGLAARAVGKAVKHHRNK